MDDIGIFSREKPANQKPVRNVEAQSPTLWQIETKPGRVHESGITNLDGDATLNHANIAVLPLIYYFKPASVSGVANFFGRVAFVGFLACLVSLLLAALSSFTLVTTYSIFSTLSDLHLSCFSLTSTVALFLASSQLVLLLVVLAIVLLLFGYLFKHCCC